MDKSYIPARRTVKGCWIDRAVTGARTEMPSYFEPMRVK